MCPYFGIHALLIVTVTLSPATATTWSEKDTSEDQYPPRWDLAPENLLDFPVKNNKIIINPWNYPERLGIYKILLNSSAKYFAAFGSQNFGNILWGLPLQHGWQFRTGMNFVSRLLEELSIYQTHPESSFPRFLLHKSNTPSEGANFYVLSKDLNLKEKS